MDVGFRRRTAAANEQREWGMGRHCCKRKRTTAEGRLASFSARPSTDRSGWKAVIRFGIRSAPKWCSRQAEFHYIVSRRMSEGRVERRLAAILAVDVAGYSRLMGADEEGTHERLKAHFAELVHPKVAKHRGRVVKNTGDGLLSEFPSVVDAVRCALEVQRE